MTVVTDARYERQTEADHLWRMNQTSYDLVSKIAQTQPHSQSPGRGTTNLVQGEIIFLQAF